VYMEIKQLRKQGFRKAQIARKLGISRTTVHNYLKREPEEMATWVASTRQRSKKLDPHHNEILSWLKKHPDMSAAQVLDWLEEKYTCAGVSESTVRNYVKALRQRYHLPKVLAVRQYEAIPDPPMGKQAQVDFGQTKQQTTKGEEIKLHFISFVLSHSRYKVVIWLDRPFTTKDVIWAHEKAFEIYGGMPEEIVYDQDHLILVKENAGDCIFTAAFQSYREERDFRVYMCKKADPESKGRIENVVGFVKNNFAKHRVFDNIDKWNEDCQTWLKRTGNGKVHNTTKKRPAAVFQLEKEHLRPVPKKINSFTKDTSSITVTIKKDNTVPYKGNRYSVPFGTYRHGESNEVKLSRKEEMLVIIMNGEIIAEHQIDHRKGELIQPTNHRRDRSKGIDTYIQSVSGHFQDSDQATGYLEEIRSRYPRYIRDHLQMIAEAIKDAENKFLEEALVMCINEKLFSGSDFRDVLTYFQRENAEKQVAATSENNITSSVDKRYDHYQPTTRDMDEYISILEGGASS